MQREKMVKSLIWEWLGENLRDGSIEVAFEQWIERIYNILLDFNGFFQRYMESSIGL